MIYQSLIAHQSLRDRQARFWPCVNYDQQLRDRQTPFWRCRRTCQRGGRSSASMVEADVTR